MSELRRYRITGGVFLVALAVIVLPMVFDADGVEPEPLAVLEVAPIEVEPLPDLTLDEAVLARAQKLRESVDDDGFDELTDTRVGDVVVEEAPDDDGSGAQGLEAVWGVQLASFSERDNAVALRNRLRDDGYPALLSEAKRLTGVSTRVAIGPIVSRAEADELRRELSARYDVEAIVVRLGT